MRKPIFASFAPGPLEVSADRCCEGAFFSLPGKLDYID